MRSIDVIIPVYNNIDITIDCIKSLYKNLSSQVNKIIIHDDCSDQHTKEILDKLNNYNNQINHNILGEDINSSNIIVVRSEQNIGFAAGVNKAGKFAQSKYLFILNSDTEVLADIITPMLNILESDSKIAAVNPSGPVFKTKRLKRCLTQHILGDTHNSNKYINSTNISGYALLINKQIFESMGGFNTIYGRGYYEDTELSRELLNNNYNLAIYPSNDITHVGQSSFKQVKKSNNLAKELMRKNQKIYYSRFPEAQQILDIYTLKSDFNKLSETTKQYIITMVKSGATVTIHSLFATKNLPYFQIKFKRIKFKELAKV